MRFLSAVGTLASLPFAADRPFAGPRDSIMSKRTTASEVGHLRALGGNVRHVRRNSLLGRVSGAMAGLANGFMHPSLIVAGFIFAITESYFLVALIAIIDKLGVLAPQIAASSLMEHHSRRRPFFVGLTVARVAAFGALVLCIWLLGRSVTTTGLFAFFSAYAVLSIVTGATHVVFIDMTGRYIPTHRVGAFFGTRSFLGGGLAVLAGLLVIQPILGGRLGNLAPPDRYLLVAVIGLVLVAADMGTFSLCREAPGHRARRRTSVGESLRRGWVWLRKNRDYRCYFWMRVGFRLFFLGLAFFVPYGKEQLGADATAEEVALLGGVLVATFRLAGVLSVTVLGRLADRLGSRAVMIWGGVFMLAGPLLTMAATLMPTAFQWAVPALSRPVDLPLVAYLLGLACLGVGLNGVIVGGNRFVVTTAPPARRASYMGFVNTATCPLALLPLLGAYFAEQFGIGVVYWLVAAGGLISLVAAASMSDAAARPAEGPARQPDEPS